MMRSGFRLFQPSSQSCTKRKCDMPALSPRGFEALRPERFYRRHPLACYRLVSTPVRAHPSVSRWRQLSASPGGASLLLQARMAYARPLMADMAEPREPVSDAFEHALAEERLRSTRNLNLFRFQGLTIFLVLAVLLRVSLPFQPIQPSLALFACYWAAAGAILLASHRSARLARLGGLAIPFIDMPMICLLTLGRSSACMTPASTPMRRASHTTPPSTTWGSCFLPRLPWRPRTSTSRRWSPPGWSCCWRTSAGSTSA